MSACPHVHMNMHVCLYTTQACPVRVCLCVHVCSDMCIHTYDPYTYGHACMYRYTCLHMCSDVCIHTYDPYTYGHACVHGCTCSDAQAWPQTQSRHSTGTEIRDPSSGLELGKATAPGRPQESALSVPHSSQRKPTLSFNLELEPSFPAPLLGDTNFPGPALLPPQTWPCPSLITAPHPYPGG